MIHLHTRSCYSLLESPFRVQEIVQAAKTHQMSHAALTDKNTMSGAMAFYHACLKEGIEPIIGLEIETEVLNEKTGLILLAKNEAGLKNLFALSTRACTSENPQLDFEFVKKHASDCVVLTAGDDAWQESFCAENRLDALVTMLEAMDDAFEDFYVSIAVNDSITARKANQSLKAAARSLSIETVALSRIEYEHPNDVQKLQLMRAIDLQTTIANPQAYARKGRYFRSPSEMEELYDSEDLQNSQKIADSIHLRIRDKASLPVYQNNKNLPSDEYLTKLCQAGLYKRCQGKIPEGYQQRLEYELGVIIKMGFANYFLIVYDFIRQARSQNILVGPGRGSAAGSLVAYCLGITHIDPMAANLLFERFLNPERISMPDIDTDFPDDRRDEVIQYVEDRYGKNHVAHIVTFSTMKARMVLRDVARATNVSLYEADRLCKLIGNAPNMTLKQAYEQNEKFRRLVESKQELEQLYKRSLGLEGLPRHASLHAGGIVFSDHPIYEYAPLVNAGSEIPAVQFTMEYLEELGLIKFDFLGLKNLSALEAMRQMVSANHGGNLDLFKIPLNDPKVYQLLSQADTLGVFQLESAGIRNLLKEYQPKRFEDIAAVLALYRPGPMQNISLYLKALKHPGSQKSLHPLLDEVLQETGGIFLYQEQIMKAAQVIGGFSLGQADMLRKAMSKKNHEVMASYKASFLEGAAQNSIPAKKAEEIFQLMERFADYGFNKSHSYAYGLVVYWMAWIKANYPFEFYISSLNACKGSAVKTSEYLAECKSRNLPVFPVSINHSGLEYERQGSGIRMPFSILKGLNALTANKILEERRQNGPYRDIASAFARLSALNLNRNTYEILINSHAFDEFGTNAASLMAALDRLIQYGSIVRVSASDQVLFDYDLLSAPVIELKKENPLDQLNREMSVYGFFISQHPAVQLRRYVRGSQTVAQVEGLEGNVSLAGRILSIHNHRTKKGDMMAFAELEDETGRIDLAIMPRTFQKIQEMLKKDALVTVQGRKDRKDSVLVNRIEFHNRNSID